MILTLGGSLVAAIEFKAQVVPSFWNNLNNRAEEAIGCAEDIWKAYREHRFGASAEPFVGYVFLLEDCPAVHRGVGVRQPFFHVDPEFGARNGESSREDSAATAIDGATYCMRYEILCRRLRLERLYTSTCLITATRGARTRITQPAQDLSFRSFVATLLGHVMAAAAAVR